MADPLYELLAPSLADNRDTTSSIVINKYLARLTTLPLSALSTTEPQSLSQSSHSNILSLQALASRSHKTTVTSVGHLSTLSDALPAVTISISGLRDAIPQLGQQAVQFSTTYSKSREENPILDRRKQAMLLSCQADKISEILELPSLLSAAIASAGGSSATGANYGQALDLFAHVKRLQIMYPDSSLVKSVLTEAEEAMRDMTTNLINSLRSQNIRFAAAIRTVGFLRRVAPELGDAKQRHDLQGVPNPSASSSEGLFGSLILTARLANLLSMLEALSPLRDLADQETARRLSQKADELASVRKASAGMAYVNQGQQTEKYLKRYIEIFRDQSFTIISMYRNVFPAENYSPSVAQLPSALATFPLHMVEILMETLQKYLPNVKEPQGRESLLIQVLYAAGSLGRLGADFSMMLSLLDNDEEDSGEQGDDSNADFQEKGMREDKRHLEAPEWARAIEKHRVQLARLEVLNASQEQREELPEIAVK